MGLADALRNVSSTLVGTFGTTATLRKIQQGSFNPATGAIPENMIQTVVSAVVLEYTNRELTETIKAGDLKMLIAAAELVEKPDSTWTVVWNNTDYEIVLVQTTYAESLPVVYEVTIRGTK